MKKLLAAFALVAFIASPALAAPRYFPSYDYCGPAEYDSSGAQVAKYCE